MEVKKRKIKAHRIREGYYEDWNTLLKDHPEISLKTEGSKVIGVNLPETATNVTCVVINNRIYTLAYYDTSKPEGEKYIKYVSPFATQSELHRIINLISFD